jgi:hypothetical protein
VEEEGRGVVMGEEEEKKRKKRRNNYKRDYKSTKIRS